MGCGCKDDGNVSVTEINDFNSLETEKLTFKEKVQSLSNIDIVTKEKVNSFLLRRDKFSFIGVILFLLFAPVILTIVIPFTVILLFNKLIFGKDPDIINFLVFSKNKKRKK